MSLEPPLLTRRPDQDDSAVRIHMVVNDNDDDDDGRRLGEEWTDDVQVIDTWKE